MIQYGSVEQAKRRRKKQGYCITKVDCGCGFYCEHNTEWRQRNIDLLGIRNPKVGMSNMWEIVQHVAARTLSLDQPAVR